MAVRIDKIKINRGGPLEKDFLLEPGDVNLVYGSNETGKTYIVESIIKLLFRTGKRSSLWDLREWDCSGSIIVSGLQDKPVPFVKTGKKLDDYWEEEIGLPHDLSRLLVVKAGETLLSREVDGVGRDILKNCLSGEGLLDRIEARISTSIQKANIQNADILGPNQGEIKSRHQLREDLNYAGSLLNETEVSYSSGEVYRLRQNVERVKAQLEIQDKAKRYYTYCLHKKKEGLELEKNKLASEQELSKIESDISVYETNQSTIKHKTDVLMKHESTEENYRWTEKAINIYRELTSEQAVAAPKSVYIVLALIFLCGAVISGIFNQIIPLGVGGIGSLVFTVLYYLGTRKALDRQGVNQELEKLKAEYTARYGCDLTDRAALEAQLDKLKEYYISATNLRRELEENLIPDITIRENNIRMSLMKHTNAELSPQEWRPTINQLRTRLSEISKEIGLLEVELASLAISEEKFLEQDPGIEWNSNVHNSLNDELTRTLNALDQELQKLNELKARIAQETHLDSADWEELITALQYEREKEARDYRQKTAEILAKFHVDTVIQEFRVEENDRIADGLESEELTKPLYAITGCYKKIRHEIDNGLILTTAEDDEYPLSEISTGAREQAFLALRMGFSSIIMKGQPAFFILDDAFQHSDWPRRENLVDQILGLAINGWQIFYFTMDDHIRDLFLKGGENLGGNFQSTELL